MSIINNRGIFNLGTAYLRQLGNDWPTAQVFFTSDITEVNSNLYYTNARVFSNTIALLPTLAGSGIQIQANGQINSNTTLTLATLSPFLTTSNVSEGSNLYYTNARVYSNVTAALAGNVTVGNIIATIHQGNIWIGLYTANVIESASNLYYTNARVYSNVIALLPTLAGSGIQIQANGQISANATTFASSSNVANTVLSLSGLTTTNLVEGSNLYYTNTRARTAYTAGKGIRILADGTIKSVAAGGEYNQSIDGATGFLVSNVNSGVTFNGVTGGDRFILRSMQVTNISNNLAYISSNVLYANGNTGYLGNLITVPQGGFVEFIGRTQIFQPGDSIYFRGYDNNYAPTSNILSAYLTYESINNDTSYVGAGQTLATSNANILLASADISDAVIESIKFVNSKTINIPVTLYIANIATNAIKSYLAFNMQVPGTSSLEVLQSVKLLKNGDGLFASYANSTNGDSIAAFTSYRKTDATTVGFTTPSVSSTGTVTVLFNTTISDGTLLYYTLQ